MTKLDRFHALALVYGKPRRIAVDNQLAPLHSMVPRKLRAAITAVCSDEEIGRWGGLAKVAYDYAFWYRNEERKLK